MSYRFTLAFILVLAMFALSGITARAQDDIEKHRSCTVCGMDRKAYGYSRMLIVYEDGSRTGVCSLHCAVEELAARKEPQVKSILVADRDSRTLIDADKAIWVMGGRKRGIMTGLPKWAFATGDAARSFVEANGGKIVSWPEALAAAREEAAPKGH